MRIEVISRSHYLPFCICLNQYLFRKYGDEDRSQSTNTAAVMEGKLKEKLESLGIGCLCLSQASLVPLESICEYLSDFPLVALKFFFS